MRKANIEYVNKRKPVSLSSGNKMNRINLYGWFVVCTTQIPFMQTGNFALLYLIIETEILFVLKWILNEKEIVLKQRNESNRQNC